MAIDPNALKPISDGYMRYEPPPAFPTTVSVGPVTVTMHLDGRIEGDPDALRDEMAKLNNISIGAPILWLVWRELVRQKTGQ